MFGSGVAKYHSKSNHRNLWSEGPRSFTILLVDILFWLNLTVNDDWFSVKFILVPNEGGNVCRRVGLIVIDSHALEYCGYNYIQQG